MSEKERKQNIRQVKTDYIPIFYGDKSVRLSKCNSSFNKNWNRTNCAMLKDVFCISKNNRYTDAH